MMSRLFRDHPASVGETYWQHLAVAGGFGAALLKASCACFVHAIVPALCQRTGSNAIRALHSRMVTNRVAGHHPVSNLPTHREDDAMIWLAANI